MRVGNERTGSLSVTDFFPSFPICRLLQVTDTKVEFTSGESVPYGLAVWAAGNGPLPLVLDLIEETPEQKEKAAWGRGRLVVDDWLRVKGSARVFALGDCGVVDGRPLPQTAQVASQQGTYLAHLFTRGYDLQASAPIRSASGTLSLSENLGLSARRSGDTLFAKPFAFLSLGILAYTGNSEALAQVEVGKGMIKGSGQAGFLLWRSVYLSKQVSWRNRTLVAIDWLKARVFGRDIVRF
jgi:NADH dehydrogenase FAD-containing subunit